ncbi:MerR family transcriptional regulator [uncultured Enterococcus sp.]|uniref:MerR family transcriptional regulator n=1 Tax=uncultured Enterococcus sp. TaxID=167972 RepID=UPI002AA7715D|nr:MerR family transcriptional regulator [uncultured Enterococcus sp.]
MEKFLSISEIAEYAGVSRRTLIYYDQIDLFKPKKIGENGYRYYSFDQYGEIDAILILKALNMPLDEIRSFLKRRNPDYTQKELLKQREKVTAKIQELEQIRAALDGYMNRYEKLAEVDFETLSFEYREEEYFVVSELIEPSDDSSTFQIYSRFYSLIQSRDIFSGYPIGFLVDGRVLDEGHIHLSPYRALVRIPKERLNLYAENQLITRPSGYYVSGFVRDEIHQLTDFSTRFKNYLKEHELVIDGDIWELMWQDEIATANREQQIFEVMLPVKNQSGTPLDEKNDSLY